MKKILIDKINSKIICRYCMIIFLTVICSNLCHAQWSAPVILSPAAVSAGLNESMGSCIGTNGDTLHVVWTDKLSSTTAAIYYTRSIDTGLTWSTPIALTSLGGYAWNPAIAINGQNVHVVWREMKPSGGLRASWYKHSTDGGNTWGPNVFLDSTADWPAVSVSGNTVYMANDSVTAATPYNTEIFFMRSLDNGNTWSPKQQLTFSVGRSEDEAIHAEGNHVYMSWNDNRSGAFQILFKESSDYGATWGPDVVIVPQTDYSTMVWSDGAYVNVVSGGNPVSTHYQIILSSSSDSGATWNANQNLTTDTAHTYFYPDMVRDSSDLHVVCGSTVGARYFHSGDGGATWDTPFSYTGSSTFVTYSYCAVHIIYVDANKKINYFRNPTGNAGHCGGIVTGVNEVKETDQTILFPNPFSNGTTIHISSLIKIENAELKIFDALGNEVRKISGINSDEIIIGRGNLSNGIYFYQLKNNFRTIASGKLMIE